MASPLAGVLTSKYSLALLLLLLVASSPPCHATDNITDILSVFPELGEFSSLLNSTDLTRDIMLRAVNITILALEDDDMAPLRAMPLEAIRQHLSLNVLLGYYDSDMLRRLGPGDSVNVSTLYRFLGDPPQGDAGMVQISGAGPANNWRVSFLPLGPAAGYGVWGQALYVRAMYEYWSIMAVLQVSATMSAPWLPGASAKRNVTGGGAKKN